MARLIAENPSLREGQDSYVPSLAAGRSVETNEEYESQPCLPEGYARSAASVSPLPAVALARVSGPVHESVRVLAFSRPGRAHPPWSSSPSSETPLPRRPRAPRRARAFLSAAVVAVQDPSMRSL